MPSGTRDTAFFGHPSGLATLFFTEMWERLSYYGARVFLAIYMTKPPELGGRGMSDVAAGTVMALYLSSVYLLSLPCGWIADRFIGQRKSVTFGGIGIILGNAMLASPFDALFFPGLAIIAVGTGFLKTSASTIVGQLYGPEDIRRDSGYTIYYMGINLGAGLAPLIGMLIAQNPGFRHLLENHGMDPNLCWKIGFAVPAIGMTVGLVQYVLGGRRLGDAGMHPTVPSEPARAARDRSVLVVIVGGLVGVVALALGINRYVVPLSKSVVVNAFGIGLLIAAVAIFTGLYRTARNAGERKRVLAMIPLFVGCIAFFGVSEQASTTLSLFAERLVHRDYLGLHVVASAYQFINSGVIVVLASVFAWFWLRLARAGKEPSTVNKFAVGMVINALSFVVMLPTLSTVSSVFGVNTDYLFAFPYRSVSPNYLIGMYVLSGCAELCISPVGLSSMSKLAPVRAAGMVMGTWFLGVSIGNYLAGRAAGLSESHGYGVLFTTLILSSAVIAIALFLVAPAIQRMMARGGEPAPLPKATVESRSSSKDAEP
ncbi:MAG TPA: peptide MFS transporter [Kofleriaceae bacterium]|nr:peptide MFS transporter [Kofleriaceae bacterium]